MQEQELLKRITFNPDIFGGKPIIRGRRLAVEHVLGMLGAGDSADDLCSMPTPGWKKQIFWPVCFMPVN